MANLRTAMDAMFYDLDISSNLNLEGVAKSIPGDPIPLDASRASKALRVQQISILGNGFPLGIIPCISSPISPSVKKELGSFCLQSLLPLRPTIGNWWCGFVGQFRPKRFLSNVKAELYNALNDEEYEIPPLKDIAKLASDKSFYSLAVCTHIPITSSTSLFMNSESHGDREGKRNRFLLFHKLPCHDITFNAAWPELFVDRKGRYWNVPDSVSLDCSSLISKSGLRYRFGAHKNSGQPQAVFNSVDSDAPDALLPGICVKGAFSYEKNMDLWREEEKEEDLIIKTDRGKFWNPSYDVRLNEPHASISSIVGGTFGAWLDDDKTAKLTSGGDGDNISSSPRKRGPFADLFGSVCYTFQHGKFKKPYKDLTRVDARLDISSASAFAKNLASVFIRNPNAQQDISAGLPRIGLIFQQQVAGPIVFRVDTKCVVDAPWKRGLQIEDFMLTLSYSLRLLESGKVAAWYSPKRKEGMIELRVYEF